jgi:hypothetical protein
MKGISGRKSFYCAATFGAAAFLILAQGSQAKTTRHPFCSCNHRTITSTASGSLASRTDVSNRFRHNYQFGFGLEC